VGQLVDEGHRGISPEHRLGVHLLHDDAAVLDSLSRQDLQAA